MSAKDNKVWETDALPVPDADIIINDPSCFGILGRTLAEALDEIETQDNGSLGRTAASDDAASSSALEATDEATSKTTTLPPFIVEPVISKRIMNALGEAMAKCHRTSVVAGAPSALLRGRIDHFNRRNNKWRIVVDNAQFRKRFPLEKYRRMRDRPSLWEVSKEKEATSEDPTKFKLEVLVFNDID